MKFLSKSFFKKNLPHSFDLFCHFDTKSPSFAYLCCLLVIVLDVLKRTPASIPRRRLGLLLNATWYKKVGIVLRLAGETKRLPCANSCLTFPDFLFYLKPIINIKEEERKNFLNREREKVNSVEEKVVKK